MRVDLKRYLGHEAGPLVQFIKYGLVGGVATATQIVVFFLLNLAQRLLYRLYVLLAF